MQFQLTEYAHSGGCGCKTAPGAFSQSLGESAGGPVFPDLLVGNEYADDAAVYRLSHSQALVATTDFFMPVVDNPFDFGRIAPTNALSDIDAMGAAPIMALVVLGIAGPQQLKRNSDVHALIDVTGCEVAWKDASARG